MEDAMTSYHFDQDGQEYFEYHGNTAIERIRKQYGKVRRDWLYFDSVEEAADFFNDHCACYEVV
jgi:hypothetical protein